MSSHATLEQLSGLLDSELASVQRHRVVRHLEGCDDCRERLAGLRSVVGELTRLESQAPPPYLGAVVRSSVRRLSRQPRLRDRLEQAAGKFTQQPGLVPAFGVVLALGAILYLFSFAVASREGRSRGTQLILESAIESGEAPGHGVGGVEDAGGRRFTFIEGVWVEAGLEEAAPDLELAGRSTASSDPELAAVLESFGGLGPAIRFRHGQRVVEINYREANPPPVPE